MAQPQTQKKRIAYVITKSSWGGAGRYVFDLATHLPHSDYEVTVICGGTGELTRRLENAGITVWSVDELERDISIKKDRAVYHKLIAVFNELRPDIVHLNSSKIGGLGALAARKASVPHIVFTAHGFAFNEARGIFWKTGTYIASWLTALLVHKLIVISQKEYGQAKRFPLVSEHKLELIHIGADQDHFLEADEARRYIQGVNKKTPKPGAVWIGSIGELHQNKDHLTALKMCKLLKDEGLSFFYFLIGEGEEREALARYIEQNDLHDHVALLGAIPSKTSGASLMQAFDIFLLPSKKEGLPYVLIEAGLAKRAVIASNVGGIPELIEHKKSGLIANTHTPLAYSLFTKQLMDEDALREKYGAELYKRVTAQFSAKTMFDKTRALYTTFDSP